MPGQTTLVDDADAAHAALSPIRRTILSELDEPASATEIGARLGLPRQKVNYHMGVLAGHGLVELAEERPRRGFIERVYRRPDALVVAPDLLATPDHWAKQAVVAAAADAIRAMASTTRPAPSLAFVSDVAFGTPADVRAFLDDVARLAARYDAAGGLPIRISLLAHPPPDQGDDP